MRLPDGTILMHGKMPYDPAKAHEYYIRTRQLKGRKKGSTFTVRRAGSKTVNLTGRELTEQRMYAAKRVNDIRNRLSELSSKLNTLMAEARQKKTESKREAKKTPTASEKSKAARESKQYQEKHQQQLATKRKTERKKEPAKSTETDPIAQLEKKITQVKGRLIAAVAKQRALNAATKNS